jgi:hypothetical protein
LLKIKSDLFFSFPFASFTNSWNKRTLLGKQCLSRPDVVELNDVLFLKMDESSILRYLMPLVAINS